MQRGFAEHFDQRVPQGARGGFAVLDSMLPTTRRPKVGVNGEWAMDHTQLPNWVVMPDGSVEKPWMTTIIDASTRFILAMTLSPYAVTTEESTETVATAIDATQQGGAPAGFGRGKTRGELLMHEFGHAVGLQHVDGRRQVMYPLMQPERARWGAADLASLVKVGANRGCLS